jgi:hypothetical protein
MWKIVAADEEAAIQAMSQLDNVMSHIILRVRGEFFLLRKYSAQSGFVFWVCVIVPKEIIDLLPTFPFQI